MTDNDQRREAILETMRFHMSQKGTSQATFSLSDLVVLCFRRWPNLFALNGYPQFPCSFRLRNHLFGELGLVSRGYVLKDTASHFRLSDNGLAVTMPGTTAQQSDLDDITIKFNKMRKKEGPQEVTPPACKGCGDIDGLMDGYCLKTSCQKRARSRR